MVCSKPKRVADGVLFTGVLSCPYTGGAAHLDTCNMWGSCAEAGCTAGSSFPRMCLSSAEAGVKAQLDEI